MNKYQQFKRFDNQVSSPRSCEYEELAVARMRKPGYRRKMRHTNHKHTKDTKNTSH